MLSTNVATIGVVSVDSRQSLPWAARPLGEIKARRSRFVCETVSVKPKRYK